MPQGVATTCMSHKCFAGALWSKQRVVCTVNSKLLSHCDDFVHNIARAIMDYYYT